MFSYQTKQKATRTVIQPKLKIGQPGDKYEREADAVADRVMTMDKGETMQMQPMGRGRSNAAEIEDATG